ncbi:MAG: SGNH/GDSL hydrolase family protein [Anaerolineaceae bacterium]|jgi:hypothetical protein
MFKNILKVIILSIFLAGCVGVQVAAPTATSAASPAAVLTAAVGQSTATPTAVPGVTTTPDDRLPPEQWQQWPVIPDKISDAALAIYRRGLQAGNDSTRFSKVGDCGSGASWFLGDFDLGPANYSLGSYTDLAPVIAAYQGSWGRVNKSIGDGWSVATELSQLWADPKQCKTGETPVACEYRIWKPSVVLILLGTNDRFHKDKLDTQLHQLVDFFIQNGVLPVLATKADNMEGDQSINLIIARTAYEYDIPLWNFWRAVQDLPHKGLDNDNEHLTWAPNRFNNAADMQEAWPVRNLGALQMMDLIWKATADVKP